MKRHDCYKNLFFPMTERMYFDACEFLIVPKERHLQGSALCLRYSSRSLHCCRPFDLAAIIGIDVRPKFCMMQWHQGLRPKRVSRRSLDCGLRLLQRISF
mmetsp:Transcript_42403/g.88333  ORF Transcript_42403/g.88333 Transcript_42403/m.88333 type:complete len:100 (-) Transcript_42403:1584-1883(-)